MRIILSRKSVDSAAGGLASPILNGAPVPLPIPTKGPSQISYGDLMARGISLGKLVEDLTNGHVSRDQRVHFDPDLRRSSYRRKPGWRPIFGQGQRAAKGHLHKYGVSVGDLFLFFGRFRRAEFRDGRYRYEPDALPVHLIYGWLAVGAVISCDDKVFSAFPWARYHPHFREGRGTVYL